MRPFGHWPFLPFARKSITEGGANQECDRKGNIFEISLEHANALTPTASAYAVALIYDFRNYSPFIVVQTSGRSLQCTTMYKCFWQLVELLLNSNADFERGACACFNCFCYRLDVSSCRRIYRSVLKTWLIYILSYLGACLVAKILILSNRKAIFLQQ